MVFLSSLARSLFLFLIFSFIVSAFVGCKTHGTVSLQEAKSITAEFVGKTFKAPPRSSDDLIELAASYDRPAALAGEIVNLRRQAETEPSNAIKADPTRYVDFLQDRTMKRYEVGDIRGSVEDARLAYRIFTRAKPDIYAGELLRRIAWREFTAETSPKPSVSPRWGWRAPTSRANTQI